VSDVRIRGSFQRAIRAPNLIELYNPAIVGLITAGEDPCAPSSFTGLIVATLQQCTRTGVTAAQYNSGSIPQGTGSQLSQLQGGNLQLKPEKANTYSVGVTYTPASVPGLSASIDYYQIKVTDEITAIPPALLLQQCLNTADPFFCGKIVRNVANGGLTGSTIAGGGYFVQTALNIGAQTLDGIDVQGTYRQALPDGFGSLSFALNGALLLKSQTQSFPGGPSYNCAGLFGVICATVDPRWRHNLRTTWTMPWNLELAATWRFIGKVSLDNNDSNPQLYGHTYRNLNTGGPAFNYFDARIPNFSYLDLAATWHAYKGIEIRAGINNVLDKDPPLVTSEITGSGANNTYETYDTLGRQLFVAFTAKF
jgi:iron complex outermembrane receptor protein